MAASAAQRTYFAKFRFGTCAAWRSGDDIIKGGKGNDDIAPEQADTGFP
jgi:hypothetical protein